MAINPSQWGRRVEITEVFTSGVSESGYVGLVAGVNLPAEIWSRAENGGGDLRVCLNSDGTSQLPLDVVDFDTVAETAVLWFRFPSFVSGESVWLFYDKTGENQPAVTNTFGRNAVWQDYEIVSHDGVSESTGNATPSAFNTTSGDVTVLGESARFNGSSSRVDFTLPSAPAATATWYIQAVAKTVNTSANKTVFGVADSTVSSDQDRLVISNNQANVSDFNGTGSNMGGTVTDVTAFNHYGFYLDQSTGPNARLFLNGSELANDFTASGDATAFNTVSLGVTADSTPLWWFDGDIQELRVNYNTPGDSRIATEYANQSNPASFWSTGTPEDTVAGATYSMTLESGSYAYTGQDVTLLANRVLTLESGAYSYTGGDISLLANRAMTLESGLYAYSGGEISLFANRKMTLEGGSYSYQGGSISLLANRIITLESGAYTYTGNDVDLVYTQNTGSTYSMTLEGGSYSYTGGEASLLANRQMQLESGSYSYVGFPVSLDWSGEAVLLIDKYSINFRQIDVTPNYSASPINAVYQGDQITLEFEKYGGI